MAVNKIINIDLDLKRVTPQALDIPKLVEGDTGNIFVITLTDDGLPVDLSACRVLVVFSKVSDSTTSEQDTEDGYIDLYYYGIELIGPSPSNGDTITVTSDGVTATAVTDVVGAVVTIDPEGWLERVKDPGTYTITYVTAGSAWQLRPHTVVISGVGHNIITIDLQTTSYGAGKNNCELQIYSGDNKDILVTTAQFNFDGRKGISNAETITRDPSYPLLVSLIAQVRSLIGKTGDMSKTDYDPVEAVRLAGGIPAYVADELGFYDPDEAVRLAGGIPAYVEDELEVTTLTEAVAVDDDDLYRIKNGTTWYKIAWSTIKSAIASLIETYFPLAIGNGGTGADNASDARDNLGVTTAIEAERPYHFTESVSALPKTFTISDDARYANITSAFSITDMIITGNTTSYKVDWTTAVDGEVTFSLNSGTFSASTFEFDLEKKQ